MPNDEGTEVNVSNHTRRKRPKRNEHFIFFLDEELKFHFLLWCSILIAN